MTSSEDIELAPGHRCLLDLLQRKLLQTIESYVKLKRERDSGQGRDEIDEELLRYKFKIKRISARQKRYTLELINGNGNNTIPKESFFAALGLITRETLNKLNSKSNERRRRTTANPRFSHEAVQARRLALEPVQKKPTRLLQRCEILQRQIDAKINQIKDKKRSNKKLEEQNEVLKKQEIDILSALKVVGPYLGSATESREGQSQQLVGHSEQDPDQQDFWIDMKCDESLDGID